MRTSHRRWIGIDGEGVGRKPHRYVMLASSDGDIIEDPKGLSTSSALDFLLQFGSRDARVAGYYLSYDWTMILKDLPDAAIYRLLRPELRAIPPDEGGGFTRVQWHEYRLHYLARAMWITKYDERVTIWDLGPYYQCPFIEALRDWKIVDDAELVRIAAMKGRRSKFVQRDRPEMRQYCLSECKALAALGTYLEQAHRDAGITPRAWHGPGSTAAAVLRREEIADKRGPDLEKGSEGLLDAANRAYFGGRFEQRLSGRIAGRIWSYDISSAYPYHAWRLPCLMHGTWRKTLRERDVERSAQALVRGHIVGASGSWAPLPVRQKNGTIVFPRAGATGWWYRDEWLVAKRGWSGLEFAEAFVLRSQCDCRPFEFLRGMYQERLRLGKSGRGRVIKLAANSVYGKLTQSVGRPQFASRLWAGMITSGTRAQLLELMMKHKKLESVLAVATDGLYSTEEIDPPESEAGQLGSWEKKVHRGLVLVRPGIYWSDDGIVRARGLGRKTLDIDRKAVLRAMARDADRVVLTPREAFGAARLCVYLTRSGELRRSKHYGQWHEIPSRLSLRPQPKRDEDWSTFTLGDIESAPYSASITDVGKVMKLLGTLREGSEL